MSVSSIASDPALRLALRSGEAVMLMSLVLIVWILILRVRLKVDREHTRKLLATWRPILADAALGTGLPAVLPQLRRRDLPVFLTEWNAMRDTVKSASAAGLSGLLRRLDLVDSIRALLQASRLTTRALATAALGGLQDRDSWDALFAQLDSGNHVLSLLAARALIDIDPRAAAPAIVARIATRAAWPAGHAAALLRRAGPQIIGDPLCGAIAGASAEEALKLLPFVNEAPAAMAAKTLRRVLLGTRDERVIAACLRATKDASLATLVRPYLDHPRWFIRLLAVEALGRIAGKQDTQRIARLLCDEQWWVRYRAAQALVALPWLGAGKVAAIESAQHDPFAREILHQAIAEVGFR